MNDIRLLLQIKDKSEKEYQSYCPFIVKMYGAFYDEGSVKVVLELMDCGSLLDALKKLKTTKTEGPYFEEPVLAKICQFNFSLTIDEDICGFYVPVHLM